MKKSLIYFGIAAFATIGFASCSDDDEPENGGNTSTVTVSEGAYILTQGNMGQKIEGSLDVIDYETKTILSGVFMKANGRSMGATPQCAVAYGSKIYLGIYESRTIEVIDAKTYKSISQIKLGETGFDGTEPRSMVADKGKVYISMYDGYVSRLDTVSLKIDGAVKVGPNPEIMGIHDNKLYVPNSDGMNYPDYGETASEISLDSFTVTKTFTVPLNPYKFISVNGDLYLVSKGNYTPETPGALYKVGDDYTCSEITVATLVAADNKKIYAIDYPWGGTPSYRLYDTETGNLEDVEFDEVIAPNNIGVDPVSGNIIITSYQSAMDGYYLPGYVYQYDNQRNFVKRYDCGIGDACIFFGSKNVASK